MNSTMDFFFQGYLLSLIFWLGIPLGSLLILMMHTLTGGAWGEKIRPSLLESTQGIGIIGLFFIPICIWGIPHLYSWSGGFETFVVHGKQAYLSRWFFNLRTFIYFVSWILIRYFYLTSEKKERWAVIGSIVICLTVSFASIDWIMSLESTWYSTIFGLLIIAGMGLSALGLVILKAAVVKESDIKSNDLGNLLLTFVMVWAYFAFSQYLVMWIGNMPEETNWYTTRTKYGWGVIAVFLILFQFIIPFIILLFRSAKNSLRVMGCIAVLILLVHLLDLFWIILPSVRTHLQVHISDLVSLIVVGAAWYYFSKHDSKVLT